MPDLTDLIGKQQETRTQDFSAMQSSKQSGVYIENFYSWETSIWKENGVGKASEVGTTHQGAPGGAWRALVYRAHLDHLSVYFFISKILKYSKTDKKYF